MPDRPLPDPAKLRADVEAWARGEQLPGRTMANLKTGGLRTILEAIAATPDEPSAAAASEALAVWMQWEKAKLVPLEALVGMDGAGLGDVLAGRVSG